MAAAVVLAAAPLPTGLRAAPSPSSTGTAPGAPAATGLPAPAASGSLQLKVRRLPDSLELVLEGVGPGPQLQQNLQGTEWQGLLRTMRPLTMRQGPQRLALPELGIEAVSLSGAGQNFQLLLQPVKGFPVMRPVVSADGSNLILTFPAAPQQSLQVGRFDLTRPTRLPQPAQAPPLQPRAVAPPLGDMAVGSMMLRNRDFIDMSGPPVTMTVKNASAKDVLMSLAQLGGYSFVWVENTASPEKETMKVVAGDDERTVTREKDIQKAQPVSASFLREPYARAFNSIVLAAGLQALREGSTVFVGFNVLSRSFGPRLSRIYRLNQVSAGGASLYLASLGAKISAPAITGQGRSVASGSDSGGSGTIGGARQPSGADTFGSSDRIQTFGVPVGPLVGLTGTIDSRLSTITLVGDPSVVAIAEQYLRQLDLRQRQVALSVKILDVNLDNDVTLANSFAFRWGNNFIVNDAGQLLGAFGQNLPPTYNAVGGFSAPTVNPSSGYPQDSFFDFVRAQIVSSSTKVLASPTLVIQEDNLQIEARGFGSGFGGAVSSSDGGLDQYSIDSPIGRSRANEAAVRVGTNVITQYSVNTASNTSSASNVITCTPSLATAGLVLGARVDKIDDNGFVTFGLSPSISAVTDRQEVKGCGFINILSVRRLDTGAVRVRDGQTLILTGVISDFDRAEVSKWPVLGDIPLIGQFFRSSGNKREKRELVILVTPRIIHDEQGGTFGYGYQPAGQDARQLLSGPPGSP